MYNLITFKCKTYMFQWTHLLIESKKIRLCLQQIFCELHMGAYYDVLVWYFIALPMGPST